jgi:N-methylhydantoinase A
LLPSGGRVDGPAIVEEFGSTTVVFPGQYVEIDPHGILVIRPSKRAPEAVR